MDNNRRHRIVIKRGILGPQYGSTNSITIQKNGIMRMTKQAKQKSRKTRKS